MIGITTSSSWAADLIEQSVHNLDLCNWVVGGHPSRVSGFGGMLVHPNEPAGRTIFDSGVLSYEYPSGATMSFTQNVFHPRGMPGGGQPTPLAAERKEADHAHITAFHDVITKGAPTLRIEHGLCQILAFNYTSHPTAHWIVPELRRTNKQQRQSEILEDEAPQRGAI